MFSMYGEVLRNRQFLKLWGAQVASQVAAQLLNYGLLIRIYDIAQGTHFANSSVSLLIIAIGLPAILFAVPAGAYVDQKDRKRVLVWTNAVRAAMVPLFIFFDSNLLTVYILAFLISISSQFFVPAEGAALPRLVKKQHLSVANSFFIFTLNASFILGYSLAAPVIGSAGIHAVYIIVTAAFIVALMLSWALPAMRPTSAVKFAFKDTYQAIVSDLHQHFRHIISTRSLLFPILLISLAQTMVGIIAALAPALSKTLFGQDLASTGHWLVVPAGVGLVLGSVTAGRLLVKMSKVRLAYTALFSASLLLVWLAFVPMIGHIMDVRPFVAASTFLLGVLDAIMLVAAQTLLQLASTDRLRGQIFGTLNMMINIAALAPVFIAGLLADIFSPLVVIAGMGVILFGVGGLFLKIFRKISLTYA